MSDPLVLFLGDEAWRLGAASVDSAGPIDVPFDAQAPVRQRVGACIRQIEQAGWQANPLLLALPSHWCLCATIETDDLGRSGRRKAMDYRLEEHLPLSAEDSVADYVELGNGQALGICCQRLRLETILAEFAEQGVPVRQIVPTALLVTAAVARSCRADAVVVVDSHDQPESLDWIELSRSGPEQWRWLADDRQALSRCIATWAEEKDAPRRLVILGSADGVEVPEPVERIDPDEDGLEAAALAAAADAADGAGWVNLRTGPLAIREGLGPGDKPVAALVSALVVLLLSLTVGMYWRAMAYDDLAASFSREQMDVFRRSVPGQPVPLNVPARLASERRRLAGLGGAVGVEGAEPVRTESALVHLRNVLQALPRDTRFRILDLNIQPDRITVIGQARSFVEAERLTVDLRKSGRYEVPPAETRVLAGRGVRFEFTARPRSPEAIVRSE